jgi:hypothetical protein
MSVKLTAMLTYYTVILEQSGCNVNQELVTL